MNAYRLVLPAALVLCAAAPLAVAQNVSISATISGEVVPGVYGRVELGSRPPPPVVYAQPVVAVPVAVAQPVPVEPIYLHVPPGHAKHWREHCHEYHACNRPVYFVRSAEYEPGYRPRHEEHGHHGHHDDERDGDEHGHGHGHHDD